MSKKITIVEALDQVGEAESKTDLIPAIELVFRLINDEEQHGLELVHKAAVVLPSATKLDYALKRSINGSAVEDQRIQRNFLNLTIALMQAKHGKIPVTPLVNYIIETCSQSAAVNKTEKQFFAFASLLLLCKAYEIWSETDDKTFAKKISTFLTELITKNSFAKSYFAAALDNATFYDEFYINLIDGVLHNSNAANPHDLELLIKIKIDCLEAWKSINDPAMLKTIKKITSDINNHLKDVYSAKFLIKLFEAVNKDPNQQDDSHASSVYRKLAQLFLSHKDMKIKALYDLFSGMGKSEKEGGSIHGNRLSSFVLLLGEILGQCSNLDLFLRLTESNGSMPALESAVQMILSNPHGKSKRLIFAANEFQNKLGKSLETGEEQSHKLQLFLLTLIFAKRELASGSFHLKDVLLHKLKNQPIKEKILEELQKSLVDHSKIESLNELKSTLNKVGLILPTVTNSEITKETFNALFDLYISSQTLAQNFEDDLRDRSIEFLTQAARTAIFEKLSHLVFKKAFRKDLRTLMESWLKINQVEDEFSNLALAAELENQHNKKADALGLLNMMLIFQNYQESDEDLESLLFNQSTEDVAVFSQNYLSTEGKLDSTDFKILTDVLVSLLNCPNYEIRGIVKDTFEGFLHLLDESTFELIEDAVFKDNRIDAANEDESESEMEVEDGSEDQDDEDQEAGDDDNEDEKDIVIGGSFF